MLDLAPWTPALLMLGLGGGTGAFLVFRLARAPADSAPSRPEADELFTRKEALLERLRLLDGEGASEDAERLHLRETLLDDAAELERRLDEIDAAPTRPSRLPRWALLAAAVGAGLLYLAARQPHHDDAEANRGAVSPTLQEREPIPTDLAALNRATHEALAQRDLPKAMRLIEAGKSLSPRDPEFLVHLSALRVLVGLDAKALPSLEEALVARPDDPEALLWLAVARWHLGDIAEARALLAGIREKGPGSEEALLAAQIEREILEGTPSSP
jgi:hypothetical protein